MQLVIKTKLVSCWGSGAGLLSAHNKPLKSLWVWIGKTQSRPDIPILPDDDDVEAQGQGSSEMGPRPPGGAQSGKASRRRGPGEEKGERRAARWGQLMEQKHSGWRQSLGVTALLQVTDAVRMEATEEQPGGEESGEQTPKN